MEVKLQLETRNQKLSEESAYAKGLASAAGVELKALSEEVTKLMHQNEKLASELSSLKSTPQRRLSNGPTKGSRRDSSNHQQTRRHEPMHSRRDHSVNHEREMLLENTIAEKEMREMELQKKVEESKQREALLENELANMWVLVAKVKKNQGVDENDLETKS
jgi:centromeric protein E